MDIVGYSDRWSVSPGDTIRFMVSAQVDAYEAALVRLIHGDPNPAGPGFKEEEIPSRVDGVYPGRVQPLHNGSYVRVADHPLLRQSGDFYVEAHIFPTTPGGQPQGLITKWDATRDEGYALVLDEHGALSLWLGAGTDHVVRLSTERALHAFTWYVVSAGYDAATGMVTLRQTPVTSWPLDESPAAVKVASSVVPSSSSVPLIMAGWCVSHDGDQTIVGGHFNGKIDSPRLLHGSTLTAAWDFSQDIMSAHVRDTSPHALHGETVNMPMRGVTGWNYSGREVDFRLAPAEYGAIFFHDDDLEDAGWQVDFSLAVPHDLRSGIYAARLRSLDGAHEDYIPFFVRPRPGTATARIAFLAPTYSYLAYGNEHFSWRNPASPVLHSVRDYLQPQDHYVVDQRLLSLYDHHADDTGNCYSSRLRPIVSLRPKYNMALIRGPHQFNADLHLIDWLETMEFSYDVITDEDLHAEGADLLAPYNVVLTGSHAEYWTGAMLDGLQSYLDDGGRLMYLSGNGLYWPVGVDPQRPHAIEVRRGQNGTGTWRSAPGENHLSTTGEAGGLWRDRGRAPQKITGVGMASQGFDVALPYRRQLGQLRSTGRIHL